MSWFKVSDFESDFVSFLNPMAPSCPWHDPAAGTWASRSTPVSPPAQQHYDLVGCAMAGLIFCWGRGIVGNRWCMLWLLCDHNTTQYLWSHNSHNMHHKSHWKLRIFMHCAGHALSSVPVGVSRPKTVNHFRSKSKFADTWPCLKMKWKRPYLFTTRMLPVFFDCNLIISKGCLLFQAECPIRIVATDGKVELILVFLQNRNMSPVLCQIESTRPSFS